MTNIAIAGTGISGLTLALRLQQLGVETVIYTDKDPDQLRAAPPDEPGGPLRAHPGPRAPPGRQPLGLPGLRYAVLPSVGGRDPDRVPRRPHDRPGSSTSGSFWPDC